jgi:hypothetical protein
MVFATAGRVMSANQTAADVVRVGAELTIRVAFDVAPAPRERLAEMADELAATIGAALSGDSPPTFDGRTEGEAGPASARDTIADFGTGRVSSSE